MCAYRYIDYCHLDNITYSILWSLFWIWILVPFLFQFLMKSYLTSPFSSMNSHSLFSSISSFYFFIKHIDQRSLNRLLCSLKIFRFFIVIWTGRHWFLFVPVSLSFIPNSFMSSHWNYFGRLSCSIYAFSFFIKHTEPMSLEQWSTRFLLVTEK